MRILGFKPNHDGSVALVENGKLTFSIEAEKDSHSRHSQNKPGDVLRALQKLPSIPEAIAVGGWHLDPAHLAEVGANEIECSYGGLDMTRMRRFQIFGSEVILFESSHERSHLYASYGMSPYRQGNPCYALVWEGTIGSFYQIDASLRITRLGQPLRYPGLRYSYLYYIGCEEQRYFGYPGMSSGPGKLMALTAFAQNYEVSEDDQALIDFLMTDKAIPIINNACFHKNNFPLNTTLKDIGVDTIRFKNVAAAFSHRMFAIFEQFAREHIRDRRPLLISGGCGLNCEWNTRWRNSNLFTDVFVPPCANDSGSAIGSALDAQHAITGDAKLQWDVYAGEGFLHDSMATDFEASALDHALIAQHLSLGYIIAWVQGRHEIGPRALGNRSLLAAPFESEMTSRLNTIKHRERFRPIAPVCLAEDVGEHFEWTGESPYMLYFQKVRNMGLRGITHVDGSARVQTVTAQQNLPLYHLLREFKNRTGVGVLCNTSLNFPGKGFINRMSDLVKYMNSNGIDLAVVDGLQYTRRRFVASESTP